jgi:hypothetical protein
MPLSQNTLTEFWKLLSLFEYTLIQSNNMNPNYYMTPKYTYNMNHYNRQNNKFWNKKFQ